MMLMTFGSTGKQRNLDGFRPELVAQEQSDYVGQFQEGLRSGQG